MVKLKQSADLRSTCATSLYPPIVPERGWWWLDRFHMLGWSLGILEDLHRKPPKPQGGSGSTTTAAGWDSLPKNHVPEFHPDPYTIYTIYSNPLVLQDHITTSQTQRCKAYPRAGTWNPKGVSIVERKPQVKSGCCWTSRKNWQVTSYVKQIHESKTAILPPKNKQNSLHVEQSNPHYEPMSVQWKPVLVPFQANCDPTSTSR